LKSFIIVLLFITELFSETTLQAGTLRISWGQSQSWIKRTLRGSPRSWTRVCKSHPLSTEKIGLIILYIPETMQMES